MTHELALNQGQAWLTETLQLMGCPVAVSAELRTEAVRPDPEGWLELDPEGELLPERAAALIGDRGVAIDALQFLANLALNQHRAADDHLHFTLELGGYRQQRRQLLSQIAIQVADRVLSSGEPEKLEDYSSADRRVLHELFEAYPHLQAVSEGREPHRSLLISRRAEE
ncbi:protein jag [Synechococcus elongatus]|uniref:Single-stranded nucleic acid binding R3H n=2 Tax=Synechococcus elongatus TaxID=32046 RepID=Q31MS1_SYNE7|nr:R3H domain-containing nucleic acid-binding protein [Synechococcus elongatus]ABB57648.1 Single-stranded nucleic acid binding R3H [Synechococcus elongatus PCC 7942 = FACHB-805]AJD57988.1 single-stranded DNA-binding protein [Synechococcus elongatus UTEX 2973]MBD2588456.1 single-stranded DNA-binding protein [Synechococcus elongatus FACHB-242]MBD2689381.1 single-stranded DNA-binding protein [Synechococcus elongatus FACHB-1061]MBD2708200.1 single-stranded DNA-binding protein [Synechococcus elonga